MNRMRSAGSVLSWLASLAMCGCGENELPPRSHCTLYLDTDAPLPSEIDPRALALFDSVRVDVYLPGETAPCAGCSHEFSLTRELRDRGASLVILPSRQSPGAQLAIRVRIFQAQHAIGGIFPAQSIDAWFALPEAKSEGETAVTVPMPAHATGSTLGSRAQPLAPLAGKNLGTLGDWPPADLKDLSSCTPIDGERTCVPGGAFWMGRAEVSSGLDPRLVVISPFAIQLREVTVAEYRTVWHLHPEEVLLWSGSHFGQQIDDWCTFTETPGPHEDLPINCISFAGAHAYCQSLGGDLPSEAEFEYIAGGRTGDLYPWGQDPPNCIDAVYALGGFGAGIAPFSISSQTGVCRPGPAPGQSIQDSIGYPYPANRADVGRDEVVLGKSAIRDLAGNLSEWARDAYEPKDGECWGARSPNILVDPTCEAQTTRGAIRGGSWLSAAGDLVVTRRANVERTSGSPNIGFRCVWRRK